MCNCQSQVQPIPCQNNCRPTLDQSSLADLVYLAGLDVNFCEKFQRLTDVLHLRDCAGNAISIDTPIVMCADFRAQLISALAGLQTNGQADGSTLLVGSDGKLYTLPTVAPPTETPNAVTDTNSIDFTASGTLNRTISGVVRISSTSDNVLAIETDGLYVPSGTPTLTTCEQIQGFTLGSPVETGTILVGADCLNHVYTTPSPVTVTDSQTIDFNLTGQNVTGSVVVNPSGIIRITSSGLTLECTDVLTCAPPVTVLDSPTVNLTVTGQQLQADVIVSPDSGNDLTTHSNGLYLDVCANLQSFVSGGILTPGVTQVIGNDCKVYTIPVSQAITVVDSPSIDLQLTGSQLSAVVKIQPNTLLTQGLQGLQVTCEDVQDCVFGTTNNFWQYNDAGNSVNFLPSADAGNLIHNGTDGRPVVLFPLTVSDTNCLNLTLTGTNLSANPIISTVPGNGLQCLDDGLWSPQATIVTVTGANTDCMQTVVNYASNIYTVEVSPFISSDPGNSIECTPSGLFAASNSTGTQQRSTTAVIKSGSSAPAEVVTGPANTYTITNPSSVRSAVVMMYFELPKLIISEVGAYSAQIESFIGSTIPSLPIALATPHNKVEISSSGDNSSPITQTGFSFILAPGQSGVVTEQVVYTNNGGSIASVVVSTYDFNFILFTV